MPIENGSFEDPGGRPGTPAGWTITASTSVESVAAFGDPPVGYEAFAWATTADELVNNALLWEVALFDLVPKTAEEFADGWGESYHREFLDGFAEQAAFDGDAAEDFEDGWDNDSPWRADFADVPAAAWPINPEGWTLSTYSRNFDVGGAPLIHIFDDPTTASAESFEGDWALLDTL